ncbi:MAG: TIGR03960 family B12-binding radical SAM protein [Planctomycetes bacterium]|nr:TIGR03960 family B12-binding radical SAM protein [Planctomycetota bacterium]
MKSLRDRIGDELLPYVERPGQYIGGELNQLPAEGDWQRARVRVAVAFPDTYTIGMSHLGCQILYWLINHTPRCCAERVYCPWGDAESIMRNRRIPLFTWDTRQTVASADILAVSLQYEMSFTSVLQILDLAGLPLRSEDRDDSHPLVIAGGPQADNPEPMAPFLDLVVLGDGEASMAAILEACLEMKDGGVPRRDMIREMARRFEWAYAPSLYDVSYHSNGTVRSIQAQDPKLPSRIERCQTSDLNEAPFPVKPLVPHVEVVHDRFAIEIMRGCPQRCRFCHAGYTKRPLRVRSVDKILDMAEQMYRATGMEEFGLLSLSTSDYPHLRELAERANKQFAPRHVNISMPSLRVDKMLQDIPWMASSVRKGGLTIAVEAANDDMRAAIRKLVTDGDLLDGVKEAYRAGWRSIKLYFMCGFPGERPTDIDGIVHLSRRVSEARRELGLGPAKVNAAVGWLVPKPYTPFQWTAQPTAEYFREARRQMIALLNSSRKKRGPLKITTHNVDRSILEAVFARGDRKLADVIEHAYRAGARFDGWDECFKVELWNRAFEATGIDPAWYAHRERSYDEIFPWDHLHGGAPTDYLARQYDEVFTQIGLSKPEPELLAV